MKVVGLDVRTCGMRWMIQWNGCQQADKLGEVLPAAKLPRACQLAESLPLGEMRDPRACPPHPPGPRQPGTPSIYIRILKLGPSRSVAPFGRVTLRFWWRVTLYCLSMWRRPITICLSNNGLTKSSSFTQTRRSDHAFFLNYKCREVWASYSLWSGLRILQFLMFRYNSNIVVDELYHALWYSHQSIQSVQLR